MNRPNNSASSERKRNQMLTHDTDALWDKALTTLETKL